MKRISRWFKDVFSPKDLQGLDIQEILDAMQHSDIRKLWLYELFEELKCLNLEVDKRLLTKDHWNLTDLAVRRKAYQDVLESVLTAKRRMQTHNPKSESGFDLDGVTVTSV